MDGNQFGLQAPLQVSEGARKKPGASHSIDQELERSLTGSDGEMLEATWHMWKGFAV
jgi:hypothetical protein